MSPYNRLSRTLVLLFVICTVWISSAFAGWQRIAFAGKEIRALAAGRDASSRQVIFIPADDSGVFMMYGTADSLYQFPFRNSTNDRPVGKLYSLLLAENGATVLAGSDSGLYGASLYFSSVPSWRKIPLESTEIVTGFAKSDSSFCAVTASRVYRSKSPFGTWLSCSLSSAPLSPVTGSLFTAVTSWPRGKGFAVGSAAAGGGHAGGYVIFGSNDARSWIRTTCLAGCTCIDGAVYSLATDSLITIFAGTSKGFVYGVEFDTGCWRTRSPQLEMPVRDMCLARMNTSGMPPDVYAATDSGVYLQSIQTTASGAWNRLLTTKTFALEVMEVNGDPVIYAGTVDGLWKYTRSTSVVGRRNVVPSQPAAGRRALYALDGKVLPRETVKKYRGVYIAQVAAGTEPAHLRIMVENP